MSLILPGNVASATASTGYEVANSCRFNDGDTAYLHKTMGAGNRKTWTYSVWIKRCTLGTNQTWTPVQADSANANAMSGYFETDDQFNLYDYNAPGVSAQIITNRKFRDIGAWYHFVIAVDTTQGTANNRLRFYVNGVDERNVGGYGSETMPAQNYNFNLNENGENFYIGCNYTSSAGTPFDGYMAEVVFIDGTQYAASDFGEFDEDSPTIWKPKDVSELTFGTNGFYLDFEDSSNLGNDVNGGTDLTEVALAATDQATDTPTNNFATWNSLLKYNSTMSLAEGNLKGTTPSTHEAYYQSFFSSIGMTAGKWYAEFKVTANADAGFIGISNNMEGDIRGSTDSAYNFAYLGQGWAYYGNDGDIFHTNTDASMDYGDSYANNDIISIALDLDNMELYFAKNGTWQNSGDPTSGASKTGGVVAEGAKALNAAGSNGVFFFCVADYDRDKQCVFEANFGGGSVSAISSGNADGNGYGNFEYAVPSGYLALCTKNLGSDGG